MSQDDSTIIWEAIVENLHDKLQYGILEQIKSVVAATIRGNELTLQVTSDEAMEFFQAEINQQRLSILSRKIVMLEKIRVERVDQSE